MKSLVLVFLTSVFCTSCVNQENDGNQIMEFATQELSINFDEMAPDGSEIRLLNRLNNGSMVHCTLPPGQVSVAVRHKTVEEIWYFIEGEGLVWRKQGEREEEVSVRPGISVTIPVGTHFQFRNTADKPLRFVIVTMPPWPGEGESMNVESHWK